MELNRGGPSPMKTAPALGEMSAAQFEDLPEQEMKAYAEAHGRALFLSLVENPEELVDDLGGLNLAGTYEFLCLLKARENGEHVYYDPARKMPTGLYESIHEQLGRHDFSVCRKKKEEFQDLSLRHIIISGLTNHHSEIYRNQGTIDQAVNQASLDEVMLASAEIGLLVSAREQFRLAALYGVLTEYARSLPSKVDEELAHHLSDRCDVATRRSMRAASHLLLVRASLGKKEKQEQRVERKK